MLPFGGQGANQAIEDAGALGYLLKGLDDASEIENRLRLFVEVRKDRVTRVQILSKTRIGREKEFEQELERYANPPGSSRFLFDLCLISFMLTRVKRSQPIHKNVLCTIISKLKRSTFQS
jgi:2-polyprenyl-6-methoxyphenol hydroxylase-like FAD-dependent oxidoreductase